jgi:MFS family permease
MNSNKIWIWLLINVYLPSVIVAIIRGILITAIPLYLISIGFTPAQVGIGTSAIFIGTLIFDLPGGVMLRKISERNLMRLSLAIITISTFLMFCILIAHQLFCLQYYLEEVEVFGYFQGDTLFHITLIYSMRGRASSFIGASERIGTFIGPAIVAALIEVASYREVFLFSFLISLTALVSIIPFKRFELPKISVEELTPFKKLHLSKGYLISLSAVEFFVQGIRSSRLILIPFVGKVLLNLPDSIVGIALSISGALDVIGSYPAGIIIDRKGRSVSGFISFGILAIGFILLALSFNYLSFYVAAIIIGLGNGFSAGLLITVGSDIGFSLGRKEGATFLAAWQFTGDIGSASSPAFIGGMAEVVPLPLLTVLIGVTSALLALSINKAFKRIDSVIFGG